MHIISARFSNVRVVHAGQQIFGLVTFEQNKGWCISNALSRQKITATSWIRTPIIGRSQSKNPQKWSYPPWSAQRHGS